MRASSFLFAALAVGAFAIVCGAMGCSAIVQPDIRRLGGTDGGGMDGGSPDVGPRDGGPDVLLPDVLGDDVPGDDAPTDVGPVCPASCDDMVGCTVDTCQMGRCVNTPNETLCGDTERCNPAIGCVPNRCTTSVECNNGVFCDGVETCDPTSTTPTGCVRGPAPSCGDALDCTVDRCDATSDACVNEPNDAVCDTFFCRTGSVCGATGCTMGAMRACADATPCTVDSCSEAMRTCVFAPRDDDSDGASPISASSPGGPVVTCAGGTDCNDMNPAIRPGATELCNAVDDNCNGAIDEGCPSALPEDCRSARVITASGIGSFTLPMPLPTLGALRDDYDSNPLCPAGDTAGRDAVYALDIVGRRDVVIDTMGSTADTILNVAFTCDAGAFTGGSVCNDDFGASSAGTTSRIWLHRVGATGVTTRVYILVDGYRGSDTGAYQLNVRWGDAISDGCATTVPLDISGGGTVLGFVTNTTSFQAGSCGSLTSPEGVYRFDGPSSGNVRLTTYSSMFGPDTYLRTACGSGELSCVNSSPVGGGAERAEIRRSVAAGTTHYFFVDGGATGNAYAVYYQPY